MAIVRFFIKGDSELSTIHVRFNKGRQFDFKRSTPYQINSKHWNSEKEKLRNVAEIQKRDFINSKLQNLRAHIEDSFIEDYAKGVLISRDWFKCTIDNFFNQETKTDLNLFTHYGKYFIENLPNRINHAKGGELGVSFRTIEKYRNIVKKVEQFERYRKSKIYVRDINQKFEKEFIKFLRDVKKLGQNTTGRTITFIKTICRDAKSNGIKTHPEIDKIKGFKTKVSFIYLTEDEISRIAMFDFSKTPYLDNARDWLIVGVCCGQRVSDFMSFTNETVNKNGFLEFTQTKTGAITLVPVHPLLQEVLQKYDGKFPRKISDQKFNEYIKEVCRQVGLTELIGGAKMNPRTNRKESGTFPKYELVSSHICRRSFATNHYGKLPTPVIMSITNHSTEKSFLTYIGKTSQDHAEILKDYWAQVAKAKKTGNAHLEVVREIG